MSGMRPTVHWLWKWHEMAHSVSSVRSTVGVLIRSGAAPVYGFIPEFKVCESFDLKINGAPTDSILGVQIL